jgi:hypothetical protein
VTLFFREEEDLVMAKLNMVEAINLALREEMERDNRVVVLGEDVGREGGVFRVTDGLQEKFGADRVVDTPLADRRDSLGNGPLWTSPGCRDSI